MSEPTVEPIVTIKHLTVLYGKQPALRDVTAAFPAGAVGLLGPNGAGKSTFMKLITGQLRPSKGTVTVLGEPIWGNPRLFFRIGFCPEQDAFYERMTGLEWVTALVRLKGLGEKESREAADRALVAGKGVWTRADQIAIACRAQSGGPLVVDERVAIRVLRSAKADLFFVDACGAACIGPKRPGIPLVGSGRHSVPCPG